MLQALTREQVRRLDAIAIEELGIPGVVLMENAGRGAAEIVAAAMDACGLRRALIFCGAGNNGGDGFVIARHLLNAGREVAVWLAGAESAIRGDALVNYQILRNMGVEAPLLVERERIVAHGSAARTPATPATMGPDDLVIDALLGTGFQGQVRSPLVDLIRAINAAEKGYTVAIDVPSALDCDSGRPGGEAIRADLTVTFVAPKVGFLQPGAVEFTGEVRVVDIGTPPSLVGRVQRQK